LAHRQLMRALTLTGQRDAALAQYRSCRQALQKELGVAPDEKTQELFAAIQSGSRLLVESATFNLPPANLPTPLTPLVGRERELARLADLFDDVDTRLVTLMGAGGIGKSRLALAAAQNAAGMFQEGVHWVSLSEVDLAAGASSRVARQ
ncbi:MAG: BTAD domain-containing putative transcriptional regulator, partial [Anaerolineae bacterium]